MIIHQPERIIKEDQVCLVAHVETRTPVPDLPTSLWFTYPVHLLPYLTESSDAFAASLLLVAMYLGEDLEVRGGISSRLASGLWEYGQVFKNWFPKLFTSVDIKFEQIEGPQPLPNPTMTGMAFSGGVDSFFTLWSHLPQNQPIQSARITHGVFVHGFDIGLPQTERYQGLFQRYRAVFQELGLELIPVSTNAYYFTQFRIKWEYAHGGPLIATGLNLGHLFHRFYINASYAYTNLGPGGTTPITDHLLSTEDMEIIHFGSSHSRYQKLPELRTFDPARQNLRVCTKPSLPAGQLNCLRCDKCLRTMTMLEVQDLLDDFSVFPHRLRLRDLFTWAQVVLPSPSTAQLMRTAMRKGKFAIALPMLWVLLMQTIRQNIQDLVLNLLTNDTRYRLRRFRNRQVNDQADISPPCH
jgi:hypothetical protein